MNKLNIRLFSVLFPVFFIFLVWMCFSYPYMFQNKTPFPSDYMVNHFPPWSYYEKFWGPVKNEAMPDIIDQIYPWRYLTIKIWKDGQIPLWNPYNFSGTPHLANFQSVVLSPFNLLFLLPNLSFIDVWGILVMLQPFIAGFFTYLLLREYGVGYFGRIVSSLCFMFCGFIVVWMAYGTLSYAISYLPLVLFSVERIIKKRNFFPGPLLSISLPLSFFSGHFQTSIYLLLISFLYICYRSFFFKSFYTMVILFLYFIFGLCLSLPQIIPSIEFYLHSSRSNIFIEGGGIPWYYLITSIAPDFFGNPVTRNDWFGYYAEYASFVGIIPLVFSFIALFKKNFLVLFFATVGIVALLFSLDSIFSVALGSLKIPVLSTSSPNRVIVIFSFCIAILAGFGIDIICDKEKLPNLLRSKILGIIGVFIIFFGTMWLYLLFFINLELDKRLIAQKNFILPTVLFLSTALVIFFSTYTKRLKILLLFIIVLLIAFDSLRFVTKWMPVSSKVSVFPSLEIIDALKKSSFDGRVFGNLGAQVESYYGISSIQGYDPLYIERYGEFVRSSDNGELLNPERSVVKLNKHAKYVDKVIDVLGVNQVFHPKADTEVSWAYPVWRDETRYSKIYTDDKFELYQNSKVLPRVSIFYDYDVVSENKEIIKHFYSNDFDFRKKLILEEKLPLKIQGGGGTASIIAYTPNRIVVEVKSNKTGLLFMNDNFYPGWNAYISSIWTKIYRADYSFRAVVIPPGVSRIEFRYEPESFKIGVFGGLFGTIGIIIVGLLTNFNILTGKKFGLIAKKYNWIYVIRINNNKK